ncbi:hypothetical protein J6590_018213 [Homalodisca vitripennis]|nr:hypothetical protein J6590_018213 [Homalodisca vitripennis]
MDTKSVSRQIGEESLVLWPCNPTPPSEGRRRSGRTYDGRGRWSQSGVLSPLTVPLVPQVVVWMLFVVSLLTCSFVRTIGPVSLKLQLIYKPPKQPIRPTWRNSVPLFRLPMMAKRSLAIAEQSKSKCSLLPVSQFTERILSENAAGCLVKCGGLTYVNTGRGSSGSVGHVMSCCEEDGGRGIGEWTQVTTEGGLCNVTNVYALTLQRTVHHQPQLFNYDIVYLGLCNVTNVYALTLQRTVHHQPQLFNYDIVYLGLCNVTNVYALTLQRTVHHQPQLFNYDIVYLGLCNVTNVYAPALQRTVHHQPQLFNYDIVYLGLCNVTNVYAPAIQRTVHHQPQLFNYDIVYLGLCNVTNVYAPALQRTIHHQPQLFNYDIC